MQNRCLKGQYLRLISQGCQVKLSDKQSVRGVVAFQSQREVANYTPGNDKQFGSVVVLGPKGQKGIRNMNTSRGTLQQAP